MYVYCILDKYVYIQYKIYTIYTQIVHIIIYLLYVYNPGPIL